MPIRRNRRNREEDDATRSREEALNIPETDPGVRLTTQGSVNGTDPFADLVAFDDAFFAPEEPVESPIQERNRFRTSARPSTPEEERLDLAREMVRRGINPRDHGINVSAADLTTWTTSSDVYLGSYQTAKVLPKTDKNNMVKTVDGKKHKLEDCVAINGEYYHKEHSDLGCCYFSGQYDLKKKMVSCVRNVVIDSNGKLSYDQSYTINKYFDRLIPIQSTKHNFHMLTTSLDEIKGWEYVEDPGSANIVDKNYKCMALKDVKYYDPFKNYHNLVSDKKDLLKLGMLSPSYLTTEGLRYSFGVELEVSRGFIQKWKAAQGLNILCIRDGSVDGGSGNGGAEYVTGVLTGDTGVNHLQKVCSELSKRTLVNHTCGVHLHIGEIDFNPAFLINSYRLALILEKEIFSTLPASRRKNAYCKKLKAFNFRPAIGNTKENLIEIEEDYNTLFKYMSFEKLNNPTFEYNKKTQHPLGAKCSYNHDTPRYCWLNYVPAMFNTRGNGSYSIEIRNHSATTNFTKIKNWLLFFMAFMKFAETYPHLIVPGLTMDDVLHKIYPKKAKTLSLYFASRKALFETKDSENEEYTADSREDVKSIKDLIN